MAERSEHPAERGLSPINPIDSEVCGGSSYPLSFPSQPPDVRNWFSSYEYESPECSGLPQDLHSFLLLADEERETQDQLGNSRKKAEATPTVEDEPLTESPQIIPRGRDLYYSAELQHEFSPLAEIIPLKENPNPLPKVGGKSSGKHGGIENADSNRSRVDDKFVKGHEESPKRIPAKTECKEHASHQQNTREIGPISPKIDTDLEVAHEVPREEEFLPRCNIGNRGFVFVKKEDNTTGRGGETFPSSLSFGVKYEDLIAGEGMDILGMPSHGNKYCSDRENLKVSPCHETFQENNSLPLKRKQNLQQLFGDGFLANYSKEASNDLISSKMYRSSVKYRECRPPKVFSEMSECKENLGANNWTRDDNTHSDGKTKEDQISQEKCSFLKCTDEELKENAATTGFFSTKNREITGDNSLNLGPKSISAMNYKDTTFDGMVRRETDKHLMNGDYISLENNGKEAPQGTRSPLADKTNFQAQVGAAPPEIPGKWRCPRRGKPYSGPPLKQLRLERWVQRTT